MTSLSETLKKNSTRKVAIWDLHARTGRQLRETPERRDEGFNLESDVWPSFPTEVEPPEDKNYSIALPVSPFLMPNARLLTNVSCLEMNVFPSQVTQTK